MTISNRSALPISRRRALTTIAALGATPLLSRLALAPVAAAPASIAKASCVLSPALTEGPYFVDERLNRSDLTTNTTDAAVLQALPLTLEINLVSTTSAGCLPLSNVQVDVWHCDALGNYSDVQSQVGQTYLRGYQVSDAAGQVTFKTIYPGWYQGRTVHIHVKARYYDASGNKTYEFTTQFFFDDGTTDTVFAAAPYNTRGTRDTRNAADSIYGNNTSLLLALSSPADGSRGYVGTMTLGLALDATTQTAAPDFDQQGLSGIWYEPATSGQGFGIEIFPNLVATGQGFAQLAWFTFDSGTAGGASKQRWYTAGGTAVSGRTSVSLVIYRNTGGNFDAGPITTEQPVGTGTLAFTTCDAAQFAYSFSDGSGRSGVIPLTRITPNVTCSTSGARPTNADFALSGNWYDPNTAGQGFFFEVNPNSPVCFFAWYTYAPGGLAIGGAASQRWFTAQTAYTAGARSFSLPLFQTTGGIFDTPTVPLPSTQSANVGTATMVFASCTNATLTYNFSAGANAGLSGTIALTRVGPTPAGCVA